MRDEKSFFKEQQVAIEKIISGARNNVTAYVNREGVTVNAIQLEVKNSIEQVSKEATTIYLQQTDLLKHRYKEVQSEYQAFDQYLLENGKGIIEREMRLYEHEKSIVEQRRKSLKEYATTIKEKLLAKKTKVESTRNKALTDYFGDDQATYREYAQGFTKKWTLQKVFVFFLHFAATIAFITIEYNSFKVIIDEFVFDETGFSTKVLSFIDFPVLCFVFIYFLIIYKWSKLFFRYLYARHLRKKIEQEQPERKEVIQLSGIAKDAKRLPIVIGGLAISFMAIILVLLRALKKVRDLIGANIIDTDTIDFFFNLPLYDRVSIYCTPLILMCYILAVLFIEYYFNTDIKNVLTTYKANMFKTIEEKIDFIEAKIQYIDFLLSKGSNKKPNTSDLQTQYFMLRAWEKLSRNTAYKIDDYFFSKGLLFGDVNQAREEYINIDAVCNISITKLIQSFNKMLKSFESKHSVFKQKMQEHEEKIIKLNADYHLFFIQHIAPSFSKWKTNFTQLLQTDAQQQESFEEVELELVFQPQNFEKSIEINLQGLNHFQIESINNQINMSL